MAVKPMISKSCFVCFILALMLGPTAAHDNPQSFDEYELYSRLEKYERTQYEGLRYLLNQYQKRNYLSLPTVKERDEWIRRFWCMVDPTPTTRTNERRIEHDERVRAARRRYPKEGFPGWDQRGETLIRFGEPDWIDEIPGKLTAAERRKEDFDCKMPGEVWHYGRLNMVVPFEEVNLAGECTYYMELKTLSRLTKEDFARNVGGDILNSDLWSYLDELLCYSPANVNELYFAATDELLAFYSHLGHNRCFHAADVVRVPLEFYFDFTSFKAGGDKVRTEVNLEIPLRELAFRSELDRQQARFQMRVAAFDMEMTEVVSATDIVRYKLPEGFSLDVPSLLPVQFILTLDPGYYRFGLEVKDLDSKKHGCYRTSRMIDPLGGGFGISDIQFASSIGGAGGEATFVKGPLRVVPHPVHAYRKPDPVKIYFEIYGLGTDDEDFGFYAVEYSIEPKQAERSGPVLKRARAVVSSRFEMSAFGSTQCERLEIDTGDLHEGSFRLIVRVMDRRTRETVEKTANFSVLE